MPITITAANLSTVVIPDLLFDDSEVRRACKKWGVKPVLYRMRRARPDERSEIINEKLGDFHEETKMM
jgi:hypothetical protein